MQCLSGDHWQGIVNYLASPYSFTEKLGRSSPESHEAHRNPLTEATPEATNEDSHVPIFEKPKIKQLCTCHQVALSYLCISTKWHIHTCAFEAYGSIN